MYIPKDRAEAGQLIPAAAEADAFWNYVQQDDYLKSHLGEYAGSYGALQPWLNRLDLKLLQDFYVTAGGKRHTLQFSADVLNFGNMLNSSWGVYDRNVVSNGGLLRYQTMANGMPQFTFNKAGSDYPTQTFEKSVSVSSTWGLQLGVRYIF